MGKNHRHTKKLKSEKAKVHISSKTKFLPKGQNVTNTAFKIKAIVIPEQLRQKDANQITSKRHQTVSELITKLRHYNEGKKAEACHDLQEIVKKHSMEPLQSHLAIILQVASSLIQDRERRVRKAAVKLIDTILEQISLTVLAPFFTYISTNLRCAMTNIDKNVQEDSLLLLDTLLERCPDMMAENSERIFPDFLTLISKYRSDSGLARTLTMNLNSTLTSVKWRIQVLSRLHKVLDAMTRKKRIEKKKSGCNALKVNASGIYCVPIYRNSVMYESCPINFLNSSRSDSSDDVLNRHVVTLVPLLYEIWLETIPEKTMKKNSDCTILNDEAAAVLCHIVQILDLLHHYAQSCNLMDQIYHSKETQKWRKLGFNPTEILDNLKKYYANNNLSNECKSQILRVINANKLNKQ